MTWTQRTVKDKAIPLFPLCVIFLYWLYPVLHFKGNAARSLIPDLLSPNIRVSTRCKSSWANRTVSIQATISPYSIDHFLLSPSNFYLIIITACITCTTLFYYKAVGILFITWKAVLRTISTLDSEIVGVPTRREDLTPIVAISSRQIIHCFTFCCFLGLLRVFFCNIPIFKHCTSRSILICFPGLLFLALIFNPHLLMAWKSTKSYVLQAVFLK